MINTAKNYRDQVTSEYIISPDDIQFTNATDQDESDVDIVIDGSGAWVTVRLWVYADEEDEEAQYDR